MIKKFSVFLVSALSSCMILSAEKIDFNRDIRPILSNNCFQCHGPDKKHRKGDLRLDIEKEAKQVKKNETAIVSGSPEKSALIQRILNADEDEHMPPADSGKKIKPAELKLLTQWIKEGAPWAEPWTYIEPKKHKTPEVSNTSWPKNWIDHFILANLEKEILKPSEDADPVTLVRRLSFDILGLPPKDEDIQFFKKNPTQGNYEKLIDQYLASPHYGERMAMYWLDLVRYADTSGYHGDQTMLTSTYRDWVIDAFNQNMPFDQFTREQLAGDLLKSPTQAQLFASGYNRLLQTSDEGGIQKKEYEAIYAADRVRNVSAVWMGATVGCAQCHDHKYDPYTMKDFYSLSAFFADISKDRFPSNKNIPSIFKYTDKQKMKLAKLNDEVKAEEVKLAKVKKDYLSKVKKLKALKHQAKVKIIDIKKSDSITTPQDDELNKIEKQWKKELSTRQKKIKQIKLGINKINKSAYKGIYTTHAKPRVTRILPRGDWLDESGEAVEPGIPDFLGNIEKKDRANRLDLANWLTEGKQKSGKLTSRVIVNRLWYLFFGEGLSASLEDFGGQGEPPVHPELLDQLALEFIKTNWDMKKVIKLILMSRSYQQSSLCSDALFKRDPYNRLIARQSRYRLPAEMVRDTMLSISGLLVTDLKGQSVKPYQPAGYYRHLNFPKRKYSQHNDNRQWRRGVYVHWQRQYLHPMLKAFDAPSREECTSKRAKSNTPLSALTLLNDPSFIEASRVFAESIAIEESKNGVERAIQFAFFKTTQRNISNKERKVLKKVFEGNLSIYRNNPDEAKAIVKTGLAPKSKLENHAKLAAWTQVARVLLSLNETMTRN